MLDIEQLLQHGYSLISEFTFLFKKKNC